MADDKSKPGGQDQTRINMHEDYEVRHWSEKFGVSKEELKRAVDKVGPLAGAVEQEVRRSHGKQ